MWISMVWIIWSTLRLLCTEVLMGKGFCMIYEGNTNDDSMNDYDAMCVYIMQCMIGIHNTLRLRLNSRGSLSLHVSAFALSPASSRPYHHWQCSENAYTA
jgi:hypothetical protein